MKLAFCAACGATDDLDAMNALTEEITVMSKDLKNLTKRQRALDKAVTALRHQLGFDVENFVCTDIDGVKHDLSPSGYYIVSESPRAAASHPGQLSARRDCRNRL